MADDMETRRKMFFSSTCISQGYREGLEWGQSHIEYLEKHACEMGELLKQREKNIADLESHLQERNETIDELEREIKIYQTAVSKITGSTSQESDEDRHQRHRRERMLDEVTLICVRDEFGISRGDLHRIGCRSRDAAADICDGINQYDAAAADIRNGINEYDAKQ